MKILNFLFLLILVYLSQSSPSPPIFSCSKTTDSEFRLEAIVKIIIFLSFAGLFYLQWHKLFNFFDTRRGRNLFMEL